MSEKINRFVRFNGYLINRLDWTLHYAGERITLNRKSFDLLLFLIDHRERVVSKDELLRSLWPDQFVEESNLTQQVFLLRKALSKHTSGEKIIETAPGRGYRFAVALEEDDKDANDQNAPVSTNPSPPAPFPSEASAPAEDLAARSHALKPATVDPPEVPSRLFKRNPSHASPRKVLSLSLALLLACLFFAVKWLTADHWHVTTYTRITNDGGAKAIGGTDGSRIYFTQLKTGSVQEVSAAGGVAVPVKFSINDAWSGDVSPDGSTLLVISQASGQGPASALWSLHLVGGPVRHLANAVLSAAWSPDGEHIVYASVDGEIFVIRRDGSEPKRIASLGGYVSSLSWSPKGTSIRFSNNGILGEMAQDGSGVHTLLPGWGNTPTQWNGAWMRDGNYVFTADNQIWLLQDGFLGNTSHTKPLQLTFGPTLWDKPISSPDGSKLFASGRTRRGVLVRWDGTSNQFNPLLGGISAEFVAFSQDRHSVAYVTYPEGILWKAKADGSNPVQLTEPPSYPKLVRWSPDAKQIVFVDRSLNALGSDALESIFVMATDGSGTPRRLLPTDHQVQTDPSWSPDGRQLVFATSPNAGASGKSGLRIFNFSTGKVTEVPGSEDLLVPRWSPDGRFISAMTLDATSLKLFDQVSRQWTTIDTGAVAFPEWSHDGKWIYYVRWTADPALVRVSATGAPREVVADLKGTDYTGAYTLWMNLDPADAPMMLRDNGTDDIYSLKLERH